MSLKDDFLKIKTYEEYDVQREKFRELDFKDKEIKEHFCSLFPKLDNSAWENGIIEEVYSYLPDGRRVLGGKGNTKPPENKRKNI